MPSIKEIQFPSVGSEWPSKRLAVKCSSRRVGTQPGDVRLAKTPRRPLRRQAGDPQFVLSRVGRDRSASDFFRCRLGGKRREAKREKDIKGYYRKDADRKNRNRETENATAKPRGGIML